MLGRSEHRIFVGTAAWAIPKQYDDAFPSEGSHLVRYASRFDSVEINSSFYRPHRVSTYQRWAGDVPEHFRFAVKMPKTITHEARLRDFDEPLQRFLEEIAGLGHKLGPILIQLPPSLKFAPADVRSFVERLRESFAGDLVWEPRHASWFTADVDAFLVEHRIARVAADPKPHPSAGTPGGWTGLVYYRLHGSPKMYYSAYSQDVIAETVKTLRDHVEASRAAWCIFDNTAAFAATGVALSTSKLLQS
ncbi:DUF72 domain-containing protein [Microvirga lotononidis]|uniref:DUF72 domain-containing protein n=1 Tax=Microvirga lotononidis TaxID=864069 RepID=I4YQL3_9HYPH|nr:DUF72 domain-containing protein [Microvirga lotononidis]EIM26255.1 hypothetical protein MicloDRAFT_00028040 [Microvirga lotononidis]WQO30633.1 DUF72 domain-containing protein [Microvirga lotononidis]